MALIHSRVCGRGLLATQNPVEEISVSLCLAAPCLLVPQMQQHRGKPGPLSAQQAVSMLHLTSGGCLCRGAA